MCLKIFLSAFSLLLSVHHTEQEAHIHLPVAVIEIASVKLAFYRATQWFFCFDWTSTSPHCFQILSETWFVKRGVMVFFSYQISSLKRKFDFGWIALFHSLDSQISYCFNVCFRVKLAEAHDVKKHGFLVPAQASCTIWHVVLETLVENLSWIMNILGTSSFLVALMRDLCMCSHVCICVCVHMCVQTHTDAWGQPQCHSL